jgi:hypothetical protein
MAITFSNGAPAKMGIGRYQMRNNRIAEITGSHMDSGVTGGIAWSRKIWDGYLCQADGRSKESAASWSDLGGFVHESDGVSGFDITKVISQEPEAQSAAPAVLENQLLCVALVERLLPLVQVGETAIEALDRIIAEREAAKQMVEKLLAVTA